MTIDNEKAVKWFEFYWDDEVARDAAGGAFQPLFRQLDKLVGPDEDRKRPQPFRTRVILDERQILVERTEFDGVGAIGWMPCPIGSLYYDESVLAALKALVRDSEAVHGEMKGGVILGKLKLVEDKPDDGVYHVDVVKWPDTPPEQPHKFTKSHVDEDKNPRCGVCGGLSSNALHRFPAGTRPLPEGVGSFEGMSTPAINRIVSGLVRGCEFLEQREDKNKIWDDQVRNALSDARGLGWGGPPPPNMATRAKANVGSSPAPCNNGYVNPSCAGCRWCQ